MKLTVLLLWISLPLISISQEAKQNTSKDQQAIQVSLAASNTLSADVAVHTLKLNATPDGQGDVDMLGSGASNIQIQGVIDLVMNVEGVDDCSFDKATQTFTIVTKPTIEIDPIVTLINENQQ